jgi:hypothetical protein
MKYGTYIKECTCTHEFQDRLYGFKKRLHNLCAGGEKARCTVCTNTIMVKKEARG